jgi:hypothetical protein
VLGVPVSLEKMTMVAQLFVELGRELVATKAIAKTGEDLARLQG